MTGTAFSPDPDLDIALEASRPSTPLAESMTDADFSRIVVRADTEYSLAVSAATILDRVMGAFSHLR